LQVIKSLNDEFIPFMCCLCVRFPIIPVSSGQS
jgi:hypothetical protein